MGVVVTAIAEQIRRSGFVPRELRSPTEVERSLFTAVRHAHGMRPDDADVCYWNWRSLRAQLCEVWSALDTEASARNGRPIQAHVWTFSRERTEAEVLNLLEAVDGRLAHLPLLSAIRRPDAAGMVASDKPRGAIASTLGVLHVALGLPMPQVITQVLDGLDSSASNEVLLDRLDAIALHAGCVPGEPDLSEIPKLLCRYYGEGLDERRWTYAEFLDHIHRHTWPGQTDEQLLEWLRSKSPEPVRRPPATRRTTTNPGTEVTPPASEFTFKRIGADRSFATIDVETANGDRASICSVGVAVFHDGELVTSWKTLCRPPAGFDKFSPFNIGLHGIRPGDITAAPTCGAAIEEAVRQMNGLPVMAHNAMFDIGAIQRACLASRVPIPEINYGCTMALTRATISFPTYGLAWCADQFNIPLNHHDAASDAEACGRLAVALL